MNICPILEEKTPLKYHHLSKTEQSYSQSRHKKVQMNNVD